MPVEHDLAVTVVLPSAGSLNLGGSMIVTVTVKNVGAQAVTGDIPVTLSSDNGPSVTGDSFDIDTLTISGGLAPGASVGLTFTWNTEATTAIELAGVHKLLAQLGTTDDNPNNNAGTATVTVIDPNAPTRFSTSRCPLGQSPPGGLRSRTRTSSATRMAFTPVLRRHAGPGGSSGGFAIDGLDVVSETRS